MKEKIKLLLKYEVYTLQMIKFGEKKFLFDSKQFSYDLITVIKSLLQF